MQLAEHFWNFAASPWVLVLSFIFCNYFLKSITWVFKRTKLLFTSLSSPLLVLQVTPPRSNYSIGKPLCACIYHNMPGVGSEGAFLWSVLSFSSVTSRDEGWGSWTSYKVLMWVCGAARHYPSVPIQDSMELTQRPRLWLALVLFIAAI